MNRSRRTLKMSPATAGMLISAAATLFVAVTAFRLAYAGSKGAAVDAGLSSSDAAWYPLCIEGALVVAAVGTVAIGGRYPWGMLVGFSLLSVAANVAHTYDHSGLAWFSLAVAAVPPLALPLCVHLMIATGKHYAARRTQTPAADEVSPASAAGPAAPMPTGGSTGPEESAPASSGPDLNVPAAVASGADGGRSSTLSAPPESAGGLGVAGFGTATPGPDTHTPSAPECAPGTPDRVHLTPVPSAVPGAPAERTRVRTRTSAASAPAGAPDRTRVTAPAGALPRTDNDLAGALRELRAGAPAGALDTIRPVARALGIGQDRARRILALLDQPGGDAS